MLRRLASNGANLSSYLKYFTNTLLDAEDESAHIEPEDKFAPSTRNWIYSLKPRPTLTKATTYRVEAVLGLQSLKGNLPSTSI
ncbi:hypothetical protein [Chlorogloea sp. CCALA 695]|uniref:hypothetical protein n=1 Tax=Chlorogloea sp. CCALA 695 TaxID=2107693 RepID=UPI0030DB3EB6